jgi:hypothetical protein
MPGGSFMNIRTMDVLSDWDDWSGNDPEWWLEHPLHRPRPQIRSRTKPEPQNGFNIT